MGGKSSTAARGRDDGEAMDRAGMPPSADIDVGRLEDGTSDEVRVAVEGAANPDGSVGRAETVLSCLLKHGHTEAVLALLRRGVPRTLATDARAHVYGRPSALHIAAYSSAAPVIAALLEAYRTAGASFPGTWMGMTPYHCAAWRGNVAAIVQMKAAGVEGEDAQTPDGHTPAMLAAGRGHAFALNALCAMGARLADSGGYDGNVLHAAARGGRYWYGDRKIKTDMAPCGRYSTDGYSTHGTTTVPEQEAPLAGAYYDIIGALAGRGMDINCRNGASMTPLLVAAEAQNIGAVDRLMELGADFHAKDSHNHGLMRYLTGGAVDEEPTIPAIRAYCDAHRGLTRAAPTGGSAPPPLVSAPSVPTDPEPPAAMAMAGLRGAVTQDL